MPTLTDLISGGKFHPTAAQLILGDALTGVSAAGTNQATATFLIADHTNVTTVAAGAGVILAAQEMGARHTVMNSGANALFVYPPVGTAILPGATNAAYSIPVGRSAIFTAVNNLIVIPNLSA